MTVAFFGSSRVVVPESAIKIMFNCVVFVKQIYMLFGQEHLLQWIEIDS